MCTLSWVTKLMLHVRQGLSAMHVRNRMPMKALDGCTPYEVLYDMKLELANLCEFCLLCAIVRLSENLKHVRRGAHRHVPCSPVGSLTVLQWTSMQNGAWQVGEGGDQVQGKSVWGLRQNFTFHPSSCRMPKTMGNNDQRGAPTTSGNQFVAAKRPLDTSNAAARDSRTALGS